MITLTQLRNRCLSRADMANSNFRNTEELDFLITTSLDELYDHLVGSYEDYFVQEMTINIASGQDSYLFAADVYKLLGVDTNTGAGYEEIDPYVFSDRNTIIGYDHLRYRWLGKSLKFLPKEHAAGEYRIYYIPRLVLDGEDIPPELEQYIDYVVIDVAIKLLQQEESDPSVLMAQKAEMKQRIKSMAANRDAGNPLTVRQTRWERCF